MQRKYNEEVSNMKKFWWTLRLAVLLKWYGFSRLFDSWNYANEECWQEYREQGLTPMEAIREDWSYGYGA